MNYNWSLLFHGGDTGSTSVRDAIFISHLRDSPGYQAADAFLNGLFWTHREALVSQEQGFAVIV
ncbi:MAG: hypothetical protein ACREBC_33280, partial [Pyrinomonadaceae bacterium]